MKLNLNFRLRFLVAISILLALQFNASFATNSLSLETISSVPNTFHRVRRAKQNSESEETAVHNRELHLPHAGSGGGSSGGSSSSSGGGSSGGGSSGGGSSGGDGGGDDGGDDGSSGGGGGGAVGSYLNQTYANFVAWLQPHSDYLGCLNYTVEELYVIWPFESDMIDCSYTHRNHSLNNDEEGENAGRNSNNNGEKDELSAFYAYPDDDADTPATSATPDVSVLIYSVLDQDDDQNDDGVDEDGAVVVTNEDFDDHFDPIEDFSISRCDTYENLWVWDLALTCKDQMDLDDCTCSFASEMLREGSMKCSDMESCPEECPICQTCFRLIGCDSHNPLVVVKNSVSNYSMYYAIAGTLGLLVLGTCCYFISRCCNDKKDREQDDIMMNSPKHLDARLLVDDGSSESVEFGIAKKILCDGDESAVSQSTYSQTTITSTSHDEQASKTEEVQDDSKISNGQQLPQRTSDEECCQEFSQEVVYDASDDDLPIEENRVVGGLRQRSEDCCQEVIDADGSGSSPNEGNRVVGSFESSSAYI